MWLRNLCVFLGKERFGWTLAEIEARLADALCPDCGGHSPSVAGFVAPIKGENAMAYAVDGLVLCTHQEITRLLPAAVLTEAVEAQVEQIETSEDRRVARRERADIRDRVYFELLPRAFTRARRTPVVIDVRNSRVWVDCAARNRAEQIVATLRDALGGLPVVRPSAELDPAAEMSRWLAEPARMPHGFECGDRCALESNDDTKASVRLTAMDLARDEVRAHLATGMAAVRLNLAVDDAIELDVDDSLDLKRIRALDVIQTDLDALDAKDAVAELHARISLQGQALRGVLDRLYAHFGVAAPASARAA